MAVTLNRVSRAIINTAVSYASKEAASAVSDPVAKINHKLYNKTSKACRELQKTEGCSKKCNTIVDNVLKKEHLEDKVKIIDYPKFIDVEGLTDSEIYILKTVAQGKNAYYAHETTQSVAQELFYENTIVANRKKADAFLLHELGHASNNNQSKLLRNIQKTNHLGSSAAKFSSIVAACTKINTPKNGKPLSKLQKAENFIHRTSPLIPIVSSFPALVEEAIASYKAIKWAEATGDKIFSSKVKKALTCAYSTYVSALSKETLETYFAMKMKDISTKILEKFN